MAAWGEGCLAYYSWKVIITSALFTAAYTAECITALLVLCRSSSPWKWDFSLCTTPQTQSSRLNQPKAAGLSLRECKNQHSWEWGCWGFSIPPWDVLWQHWVPAQRLPQVLTGVGPEHRGRTTSHPRLHSVKPLNWISYAFSLLPQPMQLISHCDKCSLALNFSSESWLPKCVQKGKSKGMQLWPRWINLNFKSTLVKQFFNTTHLGFPSSREKHLFKQSQNPQFHVSGYVHNIFYFISSHHRELLEIKCLFTFQHSSRAVGLQSRMSKLRMNSPLSHWGPQQANIQMTLWTAHGKLSWGGGGWWCTGWILRITTNTFLSCNILL